MLYNFNRPACHAGHGLGGVGATERRETMSFAGQAGEALRSEDKILIGLPGRIPFLMGGTGENDAWDAEG